MGDFKIYRSIPEKGKIKVGSADVKKIYKGEDWVWPPEDDSYIPAQGAADSEPYFISNVSTSSSFGSTNGFGLLKIKKIAPELFPPDGIAVGFEMINPAYPFSALPDTLNYSTTTSTVSTTNKYRICEVSDDYKYMYAWGRNPQGIQSIVRTEDFGQTWIEITDPAIYNENFSIYPALIATSRNGKVICVPYSDTSYSYFGFAISRDYGVTWEKAPDLFYFFRQNSAPSISLAGIPDNNSYGFAISISAGGKYIYVIKNRTLNVYRSSDFGKTFNYITISSGLSDGPYRNSSELRSVAVSGNGKRVFLFDSYAISTKRYYASNDYGQTFGIKGPIRNPDLQGASWFSSNAYSDYVGSKAIFSSTNLRDSSLSTIYGINENSFNFLSAGRVRIAGLLKSIRFDKGLNEPMGVMSRFEAGHLSSNGQFECTIVDNFYPIVKNNGTPILDPRSVYRDYNRLLVQNGYPQWQKHHQFLTSIPKIVNIT